MADQKSGFAILNLIYHRICSPEIECEERTSRL